MMVIQSPNSPEHPIVWDTASPASVNMSETKLTQHLIMRLQRELFTQSAVVIKDGKLIYERYRGILPGEVNAIVNTSTLDNNTLQNLFAERDSRDPTSSWSSAKSFTSFLIGIAELEELLFHPLMIRQQCISQSGQTMKEQTLLLKIYLI